MNALAPLDGRRVVLVFTDGGDDPGPGKHVSYGTVLKRAQAEGFMVYAIGFHSRCRCGANGRMVETDPDPSLKKIAAESGGGYFELKEGADLASTFTRVAEELHTQYVIGFTPEVMDGKLHALQVRVKRPGMSARTRKSYVASPDK
jgi:VWFA-related protein